MAGLVLPLQQSERTMRARALEQRFPWMTADGFRHLIVALGRQGADDVAWAESLGPPTDADEFARELIYVICNSGMKNTVARLIYQRVLHCLRHESPVRVGFAHKGKADAIQKIWQTRVNLYHAYRVSADDGDAAALDFLQSIPWIGPVTKFHAAKNFGVDCVKPDVHIVRLAQHARTSPDDLCTRLAQATGYRRATVDTILWRACATGLIDSRTGALRDVPVVSVPHSRETIARHAETHPSA